jgi:hypothetical protein
VRLPRLLPAFSSLSSGVERYEGAACQVEFRQAVTVAMSCSAS